MLPSVLTCIMFDNSLFQLSKVYWFMTDALMTDSHCHIDIQSTNLEKHRCYLTDNYCRMTHEATRRSMTALQLYGILNLMPLINTPSRCLPEFWIMLSQSEFRFQNEGWSWYTVTTFNIYMQENPTVLPCWSRLLGITYEILSYRAGAVTF